MLRRRVVRLHCPSALAVWREADGAGAIGRGRRGGSVAACCGVGGGRFLLRLELSVWSSVTTVDGGKRVLDLLELKSSVLKAIPVVIMSSENVPCPTAFARVWMREQRIFC
ncbi:hypothetical protein KSP39_PZI004913 [Platanthera zijinensis]|uniref:Uncharacterized protein n=1 Tax=Platanthera zijinensis TaxID=2320716 RepID=A0AAP0BUB9_9ASPA